MLRCAGVDLNWSLLTPARERLWWLWEMEQLTLLERQSTYLPKSDETVSRMFLFLLLLLLTLRAPCHDWTLLLRKHSRGRGYGVSRVIVKWLFLSSGLGPCCCFQNKSEPLRRQPKIEYN